MVYGRNLSIGQICLSATAEEGTHKDAMKIVIGLSGDSTEYLYSDVPVGLVSVSRK